MRWSERRSWSISTGALGLRAAIVGSSPESEVVVADVAEHHGLQALQVEEAVAQRRLDGVEKGLARVLIHHAVELS